MIHSKLGEFLKEYRFDLERVGEMSFIFLKEMMKLYLMKLSNEDEISPSFKKKYFFQNLGTISFFYRFIWL